MAMNQSKRTRKRVLFVVAVEAEAQAVRQAAQQVPDVYTTIMVGGVGPVDAAVSTMRALLQEEYDQVVSAGIGGGFAPEVPALGAIVLGSSAHFADLGAASGDGFLSVEQLGFGQSCLAFESVWTQRWQTALAAAGIPSERGPIITVATATGTAEGAQALRQRVPGALAEGMEGYGVARAAASCGVAFTEIRAISNWVGPRDRAAWRIPEALKALEAACQTGLEVI